MPYKIFLYIYKTIACLNVPGWIGESRASANTMNGVIAVSFVQFILLSDITVILTWISPIRYPKTYYVPVAISLLVLYCNYYWIVRRDRGNKFIESYDSKTTATKATTKLCALTVVVLAFCGLFLLHPRQF